MRGNRLYQRQGNIEQMQSAQQQDISLLVDRCLNIGEASMGETRSKWRASLRYPLIPAIKSNRSGEKSETPRDVQLKGTESHCSISQEDQPHRRVQKITVDLRAALAGVREPCECGEEVRDGHTMPTETEQLSPAYPRNTLMSNKHENQQRAHHKILEAKPSSVSKRKRKDSFELWKLKMSLPPLVKHSSQKEATPNPPLTNSPRNIKISLLQVTKQGILANSDYPFSQDDSLMAFPKVLRTNSLSSDLATDRWTSERMSTSSNSQKQRLDPSFIKSIEKSTIPFHQLLRQMGKKTSSMNHVLITEVLKSLREELWSMSEQPQHSRLDDALEPAPQCKQSNFYSS